MAMPESTRHSVVAEMELWLAERRQAIELLKSLDPEVLSAAVNCLESPLQAGQFLTTSAPSLGGRLPVEVAITPQGEKQVLNLIQAIKYGGYL